MGEDKQHARLTISSGGAKARTVAFRTTATALTKAGDSPHHVAVALEVNEWNGTIEPRLNLKAVCPPNPGACELVGEREMWAELEAELDADPASWVPVQRFVLRHDIDAGLAAPDPFAAARGRGAGAAWREGSARSSAAASGPASAAARAAM